MTDPGPDFGRQYAAQVLLDPAVNGAGNVQDALAELASTGIVCNVQAQSANIPAALNVTFPLNLDLASTLGAAWGWGIVAIPPQSVDAMGAIIDTMHLTYPDLFLPAATDIVASLYVSDLTGANTALLNMTTLATLPAGVASGGAQGVDLTTHPPTIVGDDLTTAGSDISSTAGGVFGAVLMMGFQPD